MTASELCYKSMYEGLLSIYTHTNEKLLQTCRTLMELGRQKDEKIDSLQNAVDFLNKRIGEMRSQQKRHVRAE